MTIKQRLFWAGPGTMGILVFVLVAAIVTLAVGGCAGTVPPGPTFEQSSDQGVTRLQNQPPGALGIREEGMNWAATGAANVKAVRVTREGDTQLGTGPATRQILWDPKSNAFILSSETDFKVAHATVYGPEGKPLYDVQGFETSASDPTKALAIPLAQWVAEVQAWAPAERDVVVEKLRQQADTIKATTPTAADALVRLATLIAGGGVP